MKLNGKTTTPQNVTAGMYWMKIPGFPYVPIQVKNLFGEKLVETFGSEVTHYLRETPIAELVGPIPAPDEASTAGYVAGLTGVMLSSIVGR